MCHCVDSMAGKKLSLVTPSCSADNNDLSHLWMALFVATPLRGKCEDETHIFKSENLESSGTPATLELNSRRQNTSPWGVLYTVRKALKCRCRKWPRMSHLDICSTSYGQKKGWESNWQFDSQPQKVGNRPNPGVCRWSTTHRWKALEKSYKFAWDLIPIWGLNRELWVPKVLGVQTETISDSSLGVPRIKAIWMQVWRSNAENTIWGKVVASPSSGRGESSESVLPMACPNTKGVSEGELTLLWLVLCRTE
jgi:hypothetical protein